MNDNITPVTVTILGKEYRIACSADEHEELVASARNLDLKMREIRDSGRVIGVDRIAVMAALNIAHELTQLQKQNPSIPDGLSERICRLREKIDSLLHITAAK